MKTWKGYDETVNEPITKVVFSNNLLNCADIRITNNNIYFEDETANQKRFHVYIENTFIAYPIDNLYFIPKGNQYTNGTAMIEGTFKDLDSDSSTIVFWKELKAGVIMNIDIIADNIVLKINTL